MMTDSSSGNDNHNHTHAHPHDHRHNRRRSLQQQQSDNPYDMGMTLVHETGHWLGLYHIFQGNCANQDEVADTPAQKTNYGCPTTRPDSCPGDASKDMPENYMDYTDDACMYMFTPGQVSRMLAAFETLRLGVAV